MINIPFPWFVFDVESIGLFGQAFAVGWVEIDKDGQEVDSGWVGVDYKKVSGTCDDYFWCERNIPIEVRKGNANELSRIYRVFANQLIRLNNTGSVIADCPFPVEANFLLDVQKHNPDAFVSPYSLYDVASILAALGYNPLELYERRDDEPIHHPLGDARNSARILYETYREQYYDRFNFVRLF